MSEEHQNASSSNTSGTTTTTAQHVTHSSNEFHLFTRLPVEIRLMIWEYVSVNTRPGPRVIQVFDVSEYEVQPNQTDRVNAFGEQRLRDLRETGVANFRLAGSLQTISQMDLDDLYMTDPPVEVCPVPRILHICRESRGVALREYSIMTSLAHSFYYLADRDVVFFHMNILDEPAPFMPILQWFHPEAFNTIETILFSEDDWHQAIARNGNTDTLNLFASLTRLQRVQVLWNREEHVTDGDDVRVIGRGFAAQLRARSGGLLQRQGQAPLAFELIDSDGNTF